MWIYWRLFLIVLRLTGRRHTDLVLENLVLRQQLAVWERAGRRPHQSLGAEPPDGPRTAHRPPI